MLGILLCEDACIRVESPARTHEEVGTTARRYDDHSDLNRDKKNMDSPCSGTERATFRSLSYSSFLLATSESLDDFSDTFENDASARAREQRGIDHLCDI